MLLKSNHVFADLSWNAREEKEACACQRLKQIETEKIVSE